MVLRATVLCLSLIVAAACGIKEQTGSALMAALSSPPTYAYCGDKGLGSNKWIKIWFEQDGETTKVTARGEHGSYSSFILPWRSPVKLTIEDGVASGVSSSGDRHTFLMTAGSLKFRGQGAGANDLKSITVDAEADSMTIVTKGYQADEVVSWDNCTVSFR